MKTRFLTLIALLCALLLLSATLLCACDDTKDNGDDDDNDNTTVESTLDNTTEAKTEATTTDTETTVETTVATTEETTEAAPEGYVITVVDESGAPLEGIYVQFCKGNLCMNPSATDANGVIVYDYDDDDYTVKAFDYNLFIYESVEPEYTLFKGEKTLTIVMKIVEE